MEQQLSKFNRNFDSAIMELMHCPLEMVSSFKFALKPVFENIGKVSSKDDWMKYTKLAHNKIGEPKGYQESIWLLSAGNSHYPLWVNMRKIDHETIELEFSSRFRHLKTCHNQDSGHPPFKVLDIGSR